MGRNPMGGFLLPSVGLLIITQDNGDRIKVKYLKDDDFKPNYYKNRFSILRACNTNTIAIAGRRFNVNKKL